MQAVPVRIRRFESAVPIQATRRVVLRADHLAWIVGAMGFLCMFPYPAVSVGRATALQLGNFLTLGLALPLLLMPLKGRALAIYPVILFPLVISVLKVLVTGDGDVSLSLKGMMVWVVACAAIPVVQVYGPRLALPMLTGMALATIIHCMVGIWQFVSFSRGYFPLAELYVNPSFLSVQDNAQIIAKWTQRPFGIFPEPSAMSSSLAPFVLLWTALGLGLIRLKHTPSRWQHVLFGVAAACGLGLIILSQSGHAAITLAAVLVLVIKWFVRCKATAGTYIKLAIAMGVVLPVVLWFAANSLSKRVGGSEMGNSSWEERSLSLANGFAMLTERDLPTAFFGVGVGLSAPLQWELARIDAVFSVLLTYIYETGIVGIVAMGWIGNHLWRMWRLARFDLVFIAIFVVWLVGVTLTTSYEQLLPLWIAAGWLTVWPALCQTAEDPEMVLERASSGGSGPISRSPWKPQPTGNRLITSAVGPGDGRTVTTVTVDASRSPGSPTVDKETSA